MSGNENLIKAAERQRNKAISSILAVKDELQDVLTEEDADYLRKAILDEINHYHNSIIDLLMSNPDLPQGAIFNERYLEMIEEIHRSVHG